MHRTARALFAISVCLYLTPGCSDDSNGTSLTPDGAAPQASVTDGAVEDCGADGGQIQVGPLLEMPLIDSPIVDRPFNHSAEVTIAALNGHVALAYINMHFLAADTFDTTGFHKRVGVAVSHDRGDGFGPGIDPGAGTQTTDPVIRAGPILPPRVRTTVLSLFCGTEPARRCRKVRTWSAAPGTWNSTCAQASA